MKLAITDSVFMIDLYELGLVESFFCLGFEIHCATEIYNELPIIIQQAFLNDLHLHKVDCNAYNVNYTTTISHSDKAGHFIAAKVEGIVPWMSVQSKKVAGERASPCHGMLWIIEQMMVKGIIDNKLAIQKLKNWLIVNPFCGSNTLIVTTVKKKIESINLNL